MGSLVSGAACVSRVILSWGCVPCSLSLLASSLGRSSVRSSCSPWSPSVSWAFPFPLPVSSGRSPVAPPPPRVSPFVLALLVAAVGEVLCARGFRGSSCPVGVSCAFARFCLALGSRWCPARCRPLLGRFRSPLSSPPSLPVGPFRSPLRSVRSPLVLPSPVRFAPVPVRLARGSLRSLPVRPPPPGLPSALARLRPWLRVRLLLPLSPPLTSSLFPPRCLPGPLPSPRRLSPPLPPGSPLARARPCLALASLALPAPVRCCALAPAPRSRGGWGPLFWRIPTPSAPTPPTDRLHPHYPSNPPVPRPAHCRATGPEPSRHRSALRRT